MYLYYDHFYFTITAQKKQAIVSVCLFEILRLRSRVTFCCPYCHSKRNQESY